jgi:glutathione S-transferase
VAQSKTEISVWGVGTPRTMRVHWILQELNLSYQTNPIQSRSGETQTAEYTQLNPKQKIPFIVDGAFSLSESLAILRYIDQKFGQNGDMNRAHTDAMKAASDEWCAFALSELDATTLYVIRRHKDLKDIYGDAPNVVQSAQEYFERMANSALPALEAAPHYLISDKLDVADIMLTTCIEWAQFYEVPLPSTYLDYYNIVAERPSYKNAFEYNYGFASQ